MKFHPLELTAAHLTYLIVAGFLIVYALFSVFIRNTLHLSEPPLALLTGILFGPKGFNIIDPVQWGVRDDNIVQELTRVIAGLQVFAVGLELPRRYMFRHWKSLCFLLGPVMAFGWVICAAFTKLLIGCDWGTALIIAACLTPTDPVLAASVISNSRFSTRIPARIKHLLAAESGCNDGVSFPFLYAGLMLVLRSNFADGFEEWAVTTVLYQCALGTVVGFVLGLLANRALRFSDQNRLIGPTSFIVFYLLLAILSIGLASTLGLDDYLVAFAAGAAFSHDGWFAKITQHNDLNVILDMILNSGFFVYLGSVIPWNTFVARDITPELSPGRLIALLLLVILFRRIPVVLALKPLIPDIKTWREALFCGHFGPMGVGALFLVIQARAQLETDSAVPRPKPVPGEPYEYNIQLIWPVVNFIVMGSTLIHGLSVAVISFYSHFVKRYIHKVDAHPAEPLQGMHHHDSEIDSEELEDAEDAEQDGGWEERRNRIVLPD